VGDLRAPSGLTTAAFVAQTLSLSLRLRAPERALWRDLGASRRRIVLIVGVELGLLFGAAAALALGLSELGVWALRAALAP
jgi:ABC-type antimicrobial peptide transport system permease subunit